MGFLVVPKNALFVTANSSIWFLFFFLSFQSVGCLVIPSERKERFLEAPVQKRATFPGRCISITQEEVVYSSLKDG